MHFDDGSPANSVQINLFRQQEDGKLDPVSTQLGGTMGLLSPKTAAQTDDNGYFRIAGLPAGKYVVGIIFPTLSIGYGGILGGPKLVSVSDNESAALSVYSGNVFRRKDAKPVELVAGDEGTGADIIIPLLGQHTIGGSVVALSDNHVINEAHIEPLYADDKTTLRKITLDEDGRFIFAYVPEGEYILHITDTADTVKETKHDGQMTYDIDKPVHSYGTVDQPLVLHDDVSSLIINVPE